MSGTHINNHKVRAVLLVLLSLCLSFGGVPAVAFAQGAEAMMTGENAGTANVAAQDAALGEPETMAQDAGAPVPTPTDGEADQTAGTGDNAGDEDQMLVVSAAGDQADSADEEAAAADDQAEGTDDQAAAADDQAEGADGQAEPADEIDDVDLVTQSTNTVAATGDYATNGPLSVYYLYRGTISSCYDLSSSSATDLSFYVSIADNEIVDENTTGTVRVTSSNTSVATIGSGDATWQTSPYANNDRPINVSTKLPGASTITVTYTQHDGDVYKITLCAVVYPSEAQLVSVKKANLTQVRLTWNKVGTVSGYYVMRAPLNEYGYQTEGYTTIKTVTNGSASSVDLTVPWGKRYSYVVMPYVKVGDWAVWGGFESTTYAKDYTLSAPTVKLSALERSGSTAYKLTWKASTSPASYDVMYSTKPTSGFKKVATVAPAAGSTTRSYTHKNKSATAYYRIVATYKHNGSTRTTTSNTLAYVVKTATKSLTEAGPLTVSGAGDDGVLSHEYSVPSPSKWQMYLYSSLTSDATAGKLTVTSSKEAVAKVTSGATWSGDPSSTYYTYVDHGIELFRPGKATVVVTYAQKDGSTFIVKVPVVVYPDVAKITSAKKAGYRTVKLTWKKMTSATGFYIQRAVADADGYRTGEFKTVKTVKGTATSAVVAAKWNQNYVYLIRPFVKHGTTTYVSANTPTSAYTRTYKLSPATVAITSAKASGSGTTKKLALTWKAETGATKFVVMRATSESRDYKKVATTTKKSYAAKVKAGTTYYYKIVGVYPKSGNATSPSHMVSVPAKAGATKRVPITVTNDFYCYGQYGTNWAHPDQHYTYVQGSRLVAVYLSWDSHTLRVLTYDAGMKLLSKRNVVLPTFDTWGGFYHGPDGNNYVALGYNNPKESNKKVVIKVIKYDKSWKKGKTASLLSAGTYQPFHASSTAFAMQGNTLVLMLGHTMYQSSDGLHHQSNISYAVNTKTMKGKQKWTTYVSHSFAAGLRFKDGDLYVLNHGDCRPGGIELCIKEDFLHATTDRSSSQTIFNFQGASGGNYTGARVGGMEVGSKNVLVVGTAEPHNFKVAGVTGFSGYKQNVFVALTNLATHKTKVTWLTDYNPKTSKVTVGEARVVKINEDRYGIVYNTTDDKTNKQTVHYVLIDGSGKVLKRRSSTSLVFSGSSQPTLFQGSLWWVDGEPSPYGYLTGRGTLNRMPAL